MNKWLNAIVLHSKWSKATAQPSKISAVARALDPTQPSMGRKEGFLDKLGGGVKDKVVTLRKGPQWVKRWFVLKDGILWKYATKTDAQPEKIPLYHCMLEEYNPDPTQPSNFEFMITTKQRQIILRAANEEEMHDWLNAILKQKIVIEQTIDNIELE